MSAEDDSSGDSRWRVHLEWMFENQPEFVRQFHDEGVLREHLDGKYQQALRLVAKLTQKGGLGEDEAFEVAMSAVLVSADGPAMGDDLTEPVPWQQREEILRALRPDEWSAKSERPDERAGRRRTGIEIGNGAGRDGGGGGVAVWGGANGCDRLGHAKF